MKAMFRLIVAVLLVGGWALSASALHVVWTGDKPIVIPKEHLGVRQTYVNVKTWTADDVAKNPAVVKRLVSTGNAEALAHVFHAANQQELVAQIQDTLAKGPATPVTPTTKPAEEVTAAH